MCDIIACREGSFQASEGSHPKGRCDVIMPSEGKVSFQASEGCLPKGRCDVIARSHSKLRKGAFRREGVTSSCLPKGRCDVITRSPSKLRKGAFRREGVMSSRGLLLSFGREPSEGKV
ncbi:unnamed protein product [Prunus armeniaca]